MRCTELWSPKASGLLPTVSPAVSQVNTPGPTVLELGLYDLSPCRNEVFAMTTQHFMVRALDWIPCWGHLKAHQGASWCPLYGPSHKGCACPERRSIHFSSLPRELVSADLSSCSLCRLLIPVLAQQTGPLAVIFLNFLFSNSTFIAENHLCAGAVLPPLGQKPQSHLEFGLSFTLQPCVDSVWPLSPCVRLLVHRLEITVL